MLNKRPVIAASFALALLSVLGAGWIYVKLSLAKEAEPFMTYWNNSHCCHIDAYAPRFATYGIVGKLVKLFSSDSFFRVYSKDGSLLKSSEWQLWEREFATSEKAMWIGNRAIYPTSKGYEGWVLDECL